LLISLVRAAPGASAEPPVIDPPTALIGSWEVERVAVDRADQMHWSMRPDNPLLLFRELLISTERVRFNGSKLDCKQTSWKAHSVTWAYLFSHGFPRPGASPVGSRTSAADFDFAVAKNGSATAYSLCPPLDGRPRGAFPVDTWVALNGLDQLAMHLDTQVLLILRRRPADAKPRPSFDCTKATTPTERAICGNFDLAGWDRSIAAAFRAASKGRAEREPELLQQQKQWLRERDACGATVSCIDDHLWRRVDELVQIDQGPVGR
jgi:uncharacterized protein YecT (DUF1311 family)